MKLSRPLVLERFLPYRLSILANTVSRSISRRYEERFGLSIPQWRVMAVLGLRADLSANEVAERTAMDKVTVSRAVSALVDAGRVRRATDPGDRRRSLLRLTRAGRAVYGQIAPLARAYERELTAALERTELATLERLLERLTDRARTLAWDEEPPGTARSRASAPR